MPVTPMSLIGSALQNYVTSRRGMKIVFQGEIGANSHMACQSVFPNLAVQPCVTFEECFALLEAGQADLGMIPIENSVAGRVADTHHLLPESHLWIVGEYFMPISFHLMGLPGSTLDKLKTVHSHVMALGQCRKAIRRFGLSPSVEADTAGSARLVAEKKDPSAAAIAPALAAEIYGLEIFARNIEDAAHNTTRFVLLCPEKLGHAEEKGSCLTTFVFRVRNVPAALYKALGGFATNSVNITKIESYQIEGNFFASQFYVDIEGRPEDPPVARALEELAFFSEEVRLIGTYPVSPSRLAIKEGGRIDF